jgi:hypothetical protein
MFASIPCARGLALLVTKAYILWRISVGENAKGELRLDDLYISESAPRSRASQATY